MKEFNFIHVSCSTRDAAELLDGFSPNHPLMVQFPNSGQNATGFNFHFFQDHHIMAHLMVIAGVFKSVSEAKKQGWNKPIPFGYSEIIPKNKKLPSLFIVNKISQ